MRKSDLSVLFRAVSIIAVIAAFYWQDLAAVFTSAWVDSEVSYLLAVPILVLYLVYRKRKVLDTVNRKTLSTFHQSL
jgi:hypothetical protein